LQNESGLRPVSSAIPSSDAPDYAAVLQELAGVSARVDQLTHAFQLACEYAGIDLARFLPLEDKPGHGPAPHLKAV